MNFLKVFLLDALFFFSLKTIEIKKWGMKKKSRVLDLKLFKLNSLQFKETELLKEVTNFDTCAYTCGINCPKEGGG